MRLFRRYSGTACAYGISSLCTFALSIVVARSLTSDGVVLVALVVAASALAAAVGNGIDAAGARTVVRSGERRPTSIFLHATRLRLGCLAVTIVPLAAYLVYATGKLPFGTDARIAALGGLLAYSLGSTAAYLLCYEPQAEANIPRQAAIQAAFAVPVLAGASIAIAVDAGVTGVLVGMVAGAVPAIAWLAYKTLGARRGEKTESDGRARDFRALAVALTAGTLAFAIFQRLDLLWVGATRTSAEAAQYAVANRVVSGFSLLTATLVVVGLPTIGAASTRSDALRALGRLRGPLLGVAALLGVSLAAAPVVVPFVFGSGYSRAGAITAILLLQYVPLLTYSLINIPLPFICGRRAVVLQAIAMLGVETVWLVVFRGADLTVLALAPFAGQCGAAAVTWLQFTRADRETGLAASGAST